MKINFLYYGPDAIELVAGLLSAMPVGPDGITFGKKADGTIADHRNPDTWVISFRPVGGDKSRTRHYRSARDAARAVLDGKHNQYAEEER
jgi:hypothetical protein